MAAKYQLITELYQRTGRTVTRNPQAWQSFLSSACRNYKCRLNKIAARWPTRAVAQFYFINK